MSKPKHLKIGLMILIVLVVNLFFSLDSTFGLSLAFLGLLLMNYLVDKRLPAVKQPEVGNFMALLQVVLIIGLTHVLRFFNMPGVISLPVVVSLTLVLMPYFRPYSFNEPK